MADRHRAALFVLPALFTACAYLTNTQAQTPPAAPPAGGNPLALKFDTPDASRGKIVYEAACAACHGPGGKSTNPKNPGLAGQITPYLHLQLAAFRAKLRPSPSGVMHQVAGKLSDQNIADLAAYLTPLQPGPAWKADSDARTRGEKLFMAGDATRNVIACQVCHGADGRGISANHVASITNLAPEYALEVMHEFRDSPSFGGLVAPEAMRIALKPLNDRDLKDVAAYLSSMRP